MCGRYWIDWKPGEELSEIIARMQRMENPPKTGGEIFPGDRAAVICRGRSGEIRPFSMKWGFGMEGRRIINARSETAGEKPLFRESMASRRCLIPMSAYFEWEHRGREKVKYRIAPQKDGLHCLAGLYRFEADGPVFTVLTRDAAPEIRFIHPRMPVILSYTSRQDWLFGADAEEICCTEMAYAKIEPDLKQLSMEELFQRRPLQNMNDI